ncbi:MAG: MYXO-CTERM sorting domain-containing protein [Myxococcota bacterium]
MTAALALSLLLSSPAAAQDCDAAQISAYIDQVIASGDQAAYLCLATLDDAAAPLLARAKAPAAAPQVTRALAVHWIQRLDQALPHDAVRAMAPSDRRLVADAVRARRGRASPSPDHARVFAQFDWYKTDRNYTDKRLTELDRENINNLNDPPKALPPDPSATAAEAIAAAASTPATERGCQGGCSATPMTGTWIWAMLWIGWRRRGDSPHERNR